MMACTPPGPAALLDGEKLIHQGHYEAAVQRLREATQLMSHHPQAWNFLGLAYHHLGQSKQATNAYQKALQHNADLPSARYNLACLYLENGAFESAQEHFQFYKRLAGKAPLIDVKIGLAQLGLGQIHEAARSFQTALKQDPKFPEAWNGFGMIRLKQGLPRDAFDLFGKAIEHDADFTPAYLNQAIVAHRHLKDSPQALQKYRHFLFREPRSPKVFEVKRLADQLEKSIANQSLVAKIKKSKPKKESKDDSSMKTNVNQNLHKPQKIQNDSEIQNVRKDRDLQKIQKVRKDFEIQNVQNDFEIQKDREDRDEVFLDLSNEVSGKVKSKNSQTEMAKDEGQSPKEAVVVMKERVEEDSNPLIENAIRDNSEADLSSIGRVDLVAGVSYSYQNPAPPQRGDWQSASPFFERGNAAFHAGQASEAVLEYREAIAKDPAFFEAYYNMGLAAIQSGLDETALAAYEMALTIDPNHRNARYNFSLALEKKQHHIEAASELQSLLRDYPEDVQAHFTLATLYKRKLGNARLAKKHYERVLALDPHFPKAVSIRYWLSARD